MGMIDRQRETVDRRIAAACEERLPPGEVLEVGLQTTTRIPFFRAALVMFPVLFFLNYTGRDGFSPWLMGAWGGVMVAFFMRTYFIALTNRRLLLLRLRRMSTKHVEGVDAIDRDAVTEISFAEGMLNGKLRVAARDKVFLLVVPRPFRDRARELEGRLSRTST